jgi:hypothetical protein
MPEVLPDNAFALAGNWTVTAESSTVGPGAAITLNFDADDIYLDVGGTGTVDGTTRKYAVAGAPNIYALLHRDSDDIGTLKATPLPRADRLLVHLRVRARRPAARACSLAASA